MQFSAAQATAMLKALGQTAIIDDDSLAGLTLYCKFTSPQQIVSEFSASIEMTDPQAKVCTATISDLIEAGLRGRLLVTGGKEYKVKTFDQRDNGFTVLMLEDA